MEFTLTTIVIHGKGGDTVFVSLFQGVFFNV
jgi:hypothetical protein